MLPQYRPVKTLLSLLCRRDWAAPSRSDLAGDRAGGTASNGGDLVFSFSVPHKKRDDPYELLSPSRVDAGLGPAQLSIFWVGPAFF
jgi:hypothetical protein